jgi:putative protein-disulfide isomerase
MNGPILWYVADPMCSWCWGFAPVIEAVRDAYRERIRVALLLGGLRPGTTDPVTDAFRNDILHHWHEVHERTGQPFRFEGALPDGFVYDTEPASRAVVAAAELDAGQTYPMFKAIQQAFYAEGMNVTDPENLARIAASLGLDAGAFRARLDADLTLQKTRTSFLRARQWGVSGFPSLILQRDQGRHLLSKGYLDVEELGSRIEAALESPGPGR